MSCSTATTLSKLEQDNFLSPGSFLLRRQAIPLHHVGLSGLKKRREALAQAKAGSKEETVFSLLRAKVSGIVLSGKRRFQKENVEISTDESFTDNGVNYLVEIDSGNMAKVLVGQYVLINALAGADKDKSFFLVVHTYKNYNPKRTLLNLAFANQQFFANKGIPYGAVHLSTLKQWNGGNVAQLVALFTQAQQGAPGDAKKRRA